MHGLAQIIVYYDQFSATHDNTMSMGEQGVIFPPRYRKEWDDFLGEIRFVIHTMGRATSITYDHGGDVDVLAFSMMHELLPSFRAGDYEVNLGEWDGAFLEEMRRKRLSLEERDASKPAC